MVHLGPPTVLSPFQTTAENRAVLAHSADAHDLPKHPSWRMVLQIYFTQATCWLAGWPCYQSGTAPAWSKSQETISLSWRIQEYGEPALAHQNLCLSGPHATVILSRYTQAVLQGVPFRGVQVLGSKRLILLRENFKRVRRTAKMK